jgi:RimJ/RimL family protein N-acetyltransferase
MGVDILYHAQNGGSNRMKYNKKDGLSYEIRPANEQDALELSHVRWQIDGETDYLDREQGEDYLDEAGFKERIRQDKVTINHLFLVAEVDGQIVGFSRCEGSHLKRLSHRVTFGVCVLESYWGYEIGKNLLGESIRWAKSQQLKKMTLQVLEKNEKALKLYENKGFVVEGVLKDDKLLSDGHYYNTLLMSKFL